MMSVGTWRGTIGWMLLIVCGAVGCTQEQSVRESPQQTRAGVEEAAPSDTSSTVVERAQAVVQALKEKDWQALASYVHPTHGVRFSPYAYVDTTDHVVLSRNELIQAASDSTVYVWGAYDGSGEPIRGTFTDYYGEFIYDEDFAAAQRGNPGEVMRSGNTINNLSAVYDAPSTTFVEYYVEGSEQYGGMDWASLRLVFQKEEERWYLVGIVHDQWTI